MYTCVKAQLCIRTLGPYISHIVHNMCTSVHIHVRIYIYICALTFSLNLGPLTSSLLLRCANRREAQSGIFHVCVYRTWSRLRSRFLPIIEDRHGLVMFMCVCIAHGHGYGHDFCRSSKRGMDWYFSCVYVSHMITVTVTVCVRESKRGTYVLVYMCLCISENRKEAGTGVFNVYVCMHAFMFLYVWCVRHAFCIYVVCM
jgi:hypothetical protein